MGKISRRTILAGASALAGAGIVSRRARAQAGEFKLKYGNDLPAAHPINKRAGRGVRRHPRGDERPRRHLDFSEQRSSAARPTC